LRGKAPSSRRPVSFGDIFTIGPPFLPNFSLCVPTRSSPNHSFNERDSFFYKAVVYTTPISTLPPLRGAGVAFIKKKAECVVDSHHVRKKIEFRLNFPRLKFSTLKEFCPAPDRRAKLWNRVTTNGGLLRFSLVAMSSPEREWWPRVSELFFKRRPVF